jgi:hypothetical protein
VDPRAGFNSVEQKKAGHSSRAVKAYIFFVRSDAGIVGLNTTLGMDVWCMHLFCVCVVLCLGNGLATGCSLVQGVVPSV